MTFYLLTWVLVLFLALPYATMALTEDAPSTRIRGNSERTPSSPLHLQYGDNTLRAPTGPVVGGKKLKAGEYNHPLLHIIAEIGVS